MKQFLFLMLLAGCSNAPKVQLGNNTEKPKAVYGSNTLEPIMITVQGGMFRTGRNMDIDGVQPIHNLTISSFKMSKYEITQAQYKAIMGTNPSANAGCDSCPVENVNWNDAQKYISALNIKYPGKGYRLPTEAEWEYAARGGSRTKSCTYSGSNNIKEVAWYDGNIGMEGSDSTHKVGTKKANELGLCDMSGNVWEWCSDWYSTPYFYDSEGANPQGPDDGVARVLRGGGWASLPNACRTDARNFYDPTFSDNDFGFRVVSLP